MVRSSQPISRSLIALAWAVALVVSALPDILAYELTGAIPGWLLWFKGGLLCVLIVYTYFCQDTRPLRPFFIVLLAFSLLNSLYARFLQSPAFLNWHSQQAFGTGALAQQGLEMVVALLLVGLLLFLRKRRAACFLVRGDLAAQIAPIRWLGEKTPSPLWRFGLIFTGVVIVGQIFMFILPLSPSAGTWLKLVPMLPSDPAAGSLQCV